MGDLAFTTENQNRPVGAAESSSVSSPPTSSQYLPSSPTSSSASSAATAPAHRSPMMTLALSEERSRAPILPPPPSHPSLPSLDHATFSSPSTSSNSMSPRPIAGSKSLSPEIHDPRSPTSTTSSHQTSLQFKSSQPRPNQQRLTRPTGFRASAALIPMDAPTQPRTYLGPSATSRKDLHVVAQHLVSTGNVKGLGRKRSRAAAGLDSPGSATPPPPPSMRRTSTVDTMVPEEEDELAAESVPSLPDTASLVEKLEDKRRKNALSARKSRQLKKETKEALEREVSRLKGLLEECERDRDYWRNVAEEARSGVLPPPSLGHPHDGQQQHGHTHKLPPIKQVLDAAAAAE